MKQKKGKMLELELIDDLLDDTDTKKSKDSKKVQEESLVIDLDASTPFVNTDNKKITESETVVATASSQLPHETQDTQATRATMSTSTTKAADDSTMKLNESKILASTNSLPRTSASNSGEGDDRVRASVGRFAGSRTSGAMSATEAALAQSENLRIAQQRILELEQEIERLRLENEQLAAAGETFRRKTDELMAANSQLELRYQQVSESKAHEKDVLLGNIQSMEKKLEHFRMKNEELEMRLSTNIQKVRVRERELENRLELVKMEGAALIHNKDDLILNLKRQIDQLNLELENYRLKSQDLNKQIVDKQDMLRRTVKALRIALAMLEGEDESIKPLKKAT